MPVRKFTCPECEAVLRPAKPLPSGKRVSCPKCGAGFIVRGDEEEEAKAAKPAKNAIKPAGKPGIDPFGDDGPETYGVIKEEVKEEIEEEDDEDEDDDDDEDRPKKPKKERAKQSDLEFRLNMSVTDPRGPAQAVLIGPSNFLMMVAVIAVVIGLLCVLYGMWPFLFSENLGIKAGRFQGANQKQKEEGDKAAPKGSLDEDMDVSKLKPEEQNLFWDAYEAKQLFLIGCMVGGGVVIVYNCFIVLGGVKMQNMESYNWSMIASIMSIIPLSFPGLGQVAGLMALMTLRSKKVVDGFFYVPPSATPDAPRKKRDVL